MAYGKIELTVSEDDEVGYLSLPAHPGTKTGVVKNCIELRHLVADYKGPELVLDFDAAGVLIGVEILM